MGLDPRLHFSFIVLASRKTIITHGKPEKKKMSSCNRESPLQLLEKDLLCIQM